MLEPPFVRADVRGQRRPAVAALGVIVDLLTVLPPNSIYNDEREMTSGGFEGMQRGEMREEVRIWGAGAAGKKQLHRLQ